MSANFSRIVEGLEKNKVCYKRMSHVRSYVLSNIPRKITDKEHATSPLGHRRMRLRESSYASQSWGQHAHVSLFVVQEDFTPDSIMCCYLDGRA